MKIKEQYEFRSILQEEADQVVKIEQVCFPPNEACQEKHMKERIQVAPELFLVAVDKRTGKIAGFLNGLSTEECAFRDEFFVESCLQQSKGSNVMLLGLDVLPEYRGQGLATEIMNQYVKRERKNGRKHLILTCHEHLVPMYEKMGYVKRGVANSTWGGEQWYEMVYKLNEAVKN